MYKVSRLINKICKREIMNKEDYLNLAKERIETVLKQHTNNQSLKDAIKFIREVLYREEIGGK